MLQFVIKTISPTQFITEPYKTQNLQDPNARYSVSECLQILHYRFLRTNFEYLLTYLVVIRVRPRLATPILRFLIRELFTFCIFVIIIKLYCGVVKNGAFRFKTDRF